MCVCVCVKISRNGCLLIYTSFFFVGTITMTMKGLLGASPAEVLFCLRLWKDGWGQEQPGTGGHPFPTEDLS